MKRTIDLYQFIKAFTDCNRKNQFSTSALETLFDYYEEIESETGEEIELDVIAICCDWTEYEKQELINEYGYLLEEEEEEKDIEAIAEELNGRTTVIESNGNYLVQTF